jgi:hypothetical protein
LLHYDYGAAAVNCWGRGKDVLQKLANPPRPSTPVPAPTEPPKTTHDRTAVIRKLEEAGNLDGAGTGELVESEGRAWDEDDVILFFWGTSVNLQFSCQISAPFEGFFDCQQFSKN